jgi:hypothetical protein
VPRQAKILSIITKSRSTESVVDKNKSQNRREELDDAGTRLGANPNKSLQVLVLQCGVARSTSDIGIRLKLLSYRITTVRGFCLQFVKQELKTACDFRNRKSADLLT